MEIIWYLFSHFLWFNSVPENSSWIKWNSMFPHNNNDSKRVSRQVIHWVWNIHVLMATAKLSHIFLSHTFIILSQYIFICIFIKIYFLCISRIFSHFYDVIIVSLLFYWGYGKSAVRNWWIFLDFLSFPYFQKLQVDIWDYQNSRDNLEIICSLNSLFLSVYR